MKFEYYVLRYNNNTSKIESWNIFNNILVQEYTEKAVKKYLRNPKKFVYRKYGFLEGESKIYGFEGFVKELDGIIKWQFWGRFEYELCVGCLLTTEVKDLAKKLDDFKTLEDLRDKIIRTSERNNELTKIDCYEMCKPNMEIIAREVIRQYKERSKK